MVAKNLRDWLIEAVSMKWLMVLLLLPLLLGCAETPKKSTISLQIGSDAFFTAEVADTPAERAEGLMFRPALGENEGMWFVFDAAQPYQFWMKNTLIPLDMVFVGEDMRIADILKADPCLAEPCARYTPRAPARYVLEISQNATDRQGIRIGDAVRAG